MKTALNILKTVFQFIRNKLTLFTPRYVIKFTFEFKLTNANREDSSLQSPPKSCLR
jgi:hypothetical protein